MKKLVTLLGPAIAIILTFAGTGYAATQAESAPIGDHEPKGFLSDYSKFEPEGATARPTSMKTRV
jgi:hypothetical protein